MSSLEQFSALVQQHLHDDVQQLALQRNRFPQLTDADFRFLLQQVEGYQRTCEKLPTLSALPDWWFPVRLSCEQCSSEATARYKAQIISPSTLDLKTSTLDTLIDLTAGYGIDTFHLAECAREAHYVERNAELCRIAEHNFQLYRPHIQVHNTTAEDFLSSLPHHPLAQRPIGGTPSNSAASNPPNFPFLCLLVSGGNSQIVLVKSHREMEIIGQTIDDAAGEAFDKCAKIMGLPYPGGPWIDRLAKEGNAEAFQFAKPNIPGYNYSFSGLKTSFLYFLRDHLKDNPNFIEEHKADLCASLQKTIIDILILKLKRAAKDLQVNEIAVAGGVSANSGLRDALIDLGRRHRWTVHIPPFSYTTDNAAMVCQAGYFKYLDGDFCPIDAAPYAKTKV